MISLPPDGAVQVAHQIEILNLMLFIYLVCKGVGYASAVFARRDPPKKSNRSKVAHSDGS